MRGNGYTIIKKVVKNRKECFIEIQKIIKKEEKEMIESMTEEERQAYYKELERLKNRTEEEILRDKGYSEEDIKILGIRGKTET